MSARGVRTKGGRRSFVGLVVTTGAMSLGACGEEYASTNPPFPEPLPPPPYFEPGCPHVDSDADTASTAFLVVGGASFATDQGFNFDG